MQYVRSTSGVAYFILLQAESKRRLKIKVSRDDNSVMIIIVLPSMGCIYGLAALKGAADPVSIRDTEPPG